KKKTDDHDSDVDNENKSKKDRQGFQFETEARATQRRQHQQPQTVKTQRKSITTTSPNRRSKSTAAITRDIAHTSSTTQFESKSIQQTEPVHTEPKPLTLSERLASIGRITSTLNTTDDDTPIEHESVQTKK
ncbi:unnamed protein product, partial [Adineta steineri]